jgi:hypothetical protein
MLETSERWGILGPDMLTSSRRVRTLEIGAAVRQFNELAVPGMGSIWTGRQLLWPLIGIAAANLARCSVAMSNIEAANAVEALACLTTLRHTRSDPRLRGTTKLQGTKNYSFRVVRRPGFYVTQPMRTSAVQPLLALGLVDSTAALFNAYQLSEAGKAFLDAACAPYSLCYHNNGVVETIALWMMGSDHNVVRNETLNKAITPLAPLPEYAAQILTEQIAGHSDQESMRRRAALEWVGRSSTAHHPDDLEGDTPHELAPLHWQDIRAGACFFRARDAAIDVLDRTEQFMGPAGVPLPLDAPLPESVRSALASAREICAAFLVHAKGRKYEESGLGFCRDMLEQEDYLTLKKLVARDGRVLRIDGNVILPAMGFQGGAPESASDAQSGEEATVALTDGARLPAGVSFRLRNLMLLDLDLHGNLGSWLETGGQA